MKIIGKGITWNLSEVHVLCFQPPLRIRKSGLENEIAFSELHCCYSWFRTQMMTKPFLFSSHLIYRNNPLKLVKVQCMRYYV